MRKMKDSGVVRLGQIPELWQLSRIKYLYSVIGSGTTPQSGNPVYYDGDRHWIQSGDLYKIKYIVDTEKKITGYAEKTISALKCYKADFIVIAMYGASIGNVSISKIDACVNQACCVIKPNEKINFNYLYYSLVNGKDIMLDMSIGGTQPNISQAKILEIPIILPPLPEQKKIADFLDAKCADIDQIRADIEKQIEILTDYKKSIITEAVTKGLDPKAKMKDSGIVRIGQIPKPWKTSRIKYLFSVIGSGTTPQSGNQMYYDGDRCWIQSGDLYKTKYIVDTEKKITEYAEKTISALKRYSADFLIVAMYGASIGNVSISKIDACVNQACCVIKPNDKVDFNYLYYSLINGKDIMLDMSIGGTQPNISQAKLLEFPVLLPPLSEQQAIASFLDEKCSEIDATIAEKQKQLETLEEYKKSLIFEYVTGKKEVV